MALPMRYRLESSACVNLSADAMGRRFLTNDRSREQGTAGRDQTTAESLRIEVRRTSTNQAIQERGNTHVSVFLRTGQSFSQSGFGRGFGGGALARPVSLS